MRRVLAIICILAIVLSMQIPVLAAENENAISPRYSYISALSAGLNISNTGIAACSAGCVIDNGDSLVLTCSLQRYNGSTWTTVKSWSATAARSTVLQKSYAVYSGYTYRVRTTCSVYNSNGVLVESGTCYSNQVVY